MAHPLEAIIQEAYAAFGRGDVDGYLHACMEDFSFNVPGRSAVAGTYRGKEGLYELARKAVELTGGLSMRTWRTYWRTIITPLFWPDITSRAMGNEKSTEPRMFTTFVMANSPNVGSSHGT